MKINTKVRYGLRTMIVIATSSSTDGILQKDIATDQDISLKYLDSIISSLKVKGLIVNVRGKGSGYRLSRPANEITIYDIYTAFERIDVVSCISIVNSCPKAGENCKARNYWSGLKMNITKLLKNETLADIIH
jgi:Rrf2 family protein